MVYIKITKIYRIPNEIVNIRNTLFDMEFVIAPGSLF